MTDPSPSPAPRRPLRIDILTTFPALFSPSAEGSVLAASIPARAQRAGLVDYHPADLRAFTQDKHQKTDDRPFGGGPGMVMSCQPVWDAVHAVEALDDRPATRVYLTPQGYPLDQRTVEVLAGRPRLLLLAGHYEGIDERVVRRLAPMEISLGDFVLSGGELAALVLIDAVVRLLPGALGDEASAAEDSFSRATVPPRLPGRPRVKLEQAPPGARLLDCPHYTRPREWMGESVPEVLLAGDHEAVARWRYEQRVIRTRERRPDLLDASARAPTPPWLAGEEPPSPPPT